MSFIKSVWVLVASVLFFSLIGCAEPDTKVVKPPKGVIPIKEAKMLDRTYGETRHALISEQLGVKDNRYSWWSIQDLEDYIADARSQAKEKGQEVTGLRVYFVAYPRSYGNQEVAGYSTLFIGPTGTSTTQQGSLNLFSSFQEDADLEIAPLNMGHSRTPPGTGY